MSNHTGDSAHSDGVHLDMHSGNFGGSVPSRQATNGSREERRKSFKVVEQVKDERQLLQRQQTFRQSSLSEFEDSIKMNQHRYKRRTSQLLAEMSKRVNKDGEIDVDSIAAIVDSHIAKKESLRAWKKIAALALFFIAVLCAVNARYVL